MKIIEKITEQDMRELETGDELMFLGQWMKPVGIECIGNTVRVSMKTEDNFSSYTCSALGVYSEHLPQLTIQKIRKSDKIPEGWIKYDPDVLPSDDVAEMEMLYESKESLVEKPSWFSKWKSYNTEKGNKRIAYRVTKWKSKTSEGEVWAVVLCGNNEQSLCITYLANQATAVEYAKRRAKSFMILAIFDPFETYGKWKKGDGLELLGFVK